MTGKDKEQNSITLIDLNNETFVLAKVPGDMLGADEYDVIVDVRPSAGGKAKGSCGTYCCKSLHKK